MFAERSGKQSRMLEDVSDRTEILRGPVVTGQILCISGIECDFHSVLSLYCGLKTAHFLCNNLITNYCTFFP